MSNVTFVGRLATYKYYNMDQVVGQALAAFKRICKSMEQPPAAAPVLRVKESSSVAELET